MSTTRQYRWHIEVIRPPDMTNAMRDIRKAYRQLRTAGLTVAQTRYTVLNLLISGSCVHVKADKLS